MEKKKLDILAVIAARGGSKGIPRKNVRLLLDNPLISYSITNAKESKYDVDIVVSTDDKEIKRISKLFGADVIDRPYELSTDEVTLDPVIYHAVCEKEKRECKKYDIIITMQPTSPILTSTTLDNAIDFFIKKDLDTIISGVNKPHLAWTEENGECIPLYKERLNRQYLPKNLLETGAFVITKREFVKETGRFGANLSVFEIPEKEAIDIDTNQDWWIAEKELMKKTIFIRTDGYSKIGMGHIYRGLLLAYNFIDHEVKFVLSNKSDIGMEKIKNSFFPYEVIENNNDFIKLVNESKCDIVINDILDTEKNYIQELKNTGARVINFEDLGEGSRFADAVLNDLYEKKIEGDNYYWGSDFYCIRDEFMLAKPSEFNEVVKEVLVLFGGTDPCNLTERLLEVITLLPKDLNIKYTFILGMGYENAIGIKEAANNLGINIDVVQNVNQMTEYMGKADIAISSQGRTMLELASMAVPTILLAQNEREINHEFGYLKNGFINLGLGKDVENKTLYETLIWLINSPQIRMQMRKQMLSVDLKKGLKRVKNIIFQDN